MNVKQKNALIIIFLIAAVTVIIIFKEDTASRQSSEITSIPTEAQEVKPEATNSSTNIVTGNKDAVKLPRLVDLGAAKCIPCKMMAPILEELKVEYKGRLQVEFLDVWKNPEVAREYNIRMIPTQIFYDSRGKELFRHEGFFSKEDILSKWKELDVELAESK